MQTAYQWTGHWNYSKNDIAQTVFAEYLCYRNTLHILQDYVAVNSIKLTLTGELWTYLADLNEQAQERLDTIMEQMKAAEGVTEELKRTSQMEWVQRCNNIHNRAEEIVLHEMIYCGRMIMTN